VFLGLRLGLRGRVCLYQGGERGSTEAYGPFEELQDPYGKRFWPKYRGRDGGQDQEKGNQPGTRLINGCRMWRLRSPCHLQGPEHSIQYGRQIRVCLPDFAR